MVISPDEEAVTGLEDRPGVEPHLCGPSLAQLAAAPPPLVADNQNDLIAPWASDLTSTHSLTPNWWIIKALVSYTHPEAVCVHSPGQTITNVLRLADHTAIGHSHQHLRLSLASDLL